MSDNRIVYKYDKDNRINSKIIYGLNWGCRYKYILNYRKVYYYHNKNINQIVKEELINNKYELISSLVNFNGSKYYAKYLNGKEFYTKFFNKNKTTFETKILIDIGESSIKELKFTKNNKIEKHIKITTKHNERNSEK
jgi:hypothetical protein